MTWDHLHDEDVLFEFRGTDPDELTSGRFYRGEVDGFAEFGVFVTLGEGVTGLLHRSKLDRRLESLDWETGDEVIVQVEDVRENGNIDLGWSIRQTPREFRGHGVDPDDEEEEEPAPPEEEPPRPEETWGDDTTTESPEEPAAAEPEAPTEPVPTEAITRHTVEELEDTVGERVRIEGRITDVRQTSGPTIFSLAEDTGVVECAAFESAGVRAYPTIETEDVVRVVGLVERHRGDIQIEAESIEALEGPDREAVVERLQDAAERRAAPDDSSLLLVDPVVADLADDLVTVATRLRQAVLEGRVILVRHPATADGVIAAAAIEHALLALSEREGPGADPTRLIERRPMDQPWFELGDAMYDQGNRRTEEPPLVVLVGAGASEADQAALRFLEIYDIPAVVVDALPEATQPPGVDGAAISESATNVSVLAAHLAGIVDETVRDALAPLPTISYRENPPDRYADLAAKHGTDSTQVRERHEAIALTAYYQRYDDKRELVSDLLFDVDAAELASHVSTQYRERIETAVRTAQNNCERLSAVGRTVTVLDGEAHSHRFDFPPRPVLAEELLRAERDAGNGDVVVVLGADEAYLAGAGEPGLSEIAEAVGVRVPEGAVEGTRDRITFLSGERDAVREALLEVLAEDST